MTAISPILGRRFVTKYQPVGTLSDAFQMRMGDGLIAGLAARKVSARAAATSVKLLNRFVISVFRRGVAAAVE